MFTARKCDNVKQYDDNTIVVDVELIGSGNPGTHPANGADIDGPGIPVPATATFLAGSKLFYPKTGATYIHDGVEWQLQEM